MKINNEQIENIKERIKDFLNDVNTGYTNKGIDSLVKEWLENKKELIEKFEASPHYEGDLRIKIPVVESRGFNYGFVNDIFWEIRDCAHLKINNEGIKSDVITVFKNLLYTGEDGGNFRCKQVVSEKLAERLTNGTGKFKDSNIAIRAGMTTLSLTIKLLKYYKVDELLGSYVNEKGELKKSYNQVEARLGDALNPKSITRDLYISLNPLDYLVMGDFVNAESCYSIRHGGCCCAGTLSYMCDKETVLTFSTDDVTKSSRMMINRQVWFINKDKDLLQSRLYPQTETSLLNIREDWANVITKEFSEMFGKEYEQIYYGSNGCSYVDGRVGYIDPLNGFNFTVFSDEMGKMPLFRVAQRQYYTDKEGNFEPENDEGSTGGPFEHLTYTGAMCCYECGYEGDRDYMHYIDGHWYCEDCCFYCEYHGEWEVGEHTYVREYGDVCNYGLNSGEFIHCDECGNWHHKNGDDEIYVDDKEFCCANCAMDSGYECVDGEWYDADFVYTCEFCGNKVLENDILTTEDDHYYCCGHCANEAGYFENAEGEWEKKESEIVIDNNPHTIQETTESTKEGWDRFVKSAEEKAKEVA